MNHRLNYTYMILPACVLIIGAGLASINQVTAQRLDRPPARELEGTAILPAGTTDVPAGTILILEMEEKLSSGSARISDRFRARVATPVVNGNGRTLIPADATVIGRVSNVKPARWARRSGMIAVTFDSLIMPNGSAIPIRGYLTPADADDRKRIDDEGILRGGSNVKRDIVFVGGGAGAGAAIGAVTGGALAGAGIGAAAGLTATLLLKGKEAVVEDGQRFGMELTQPLRTSGTPSREGRQGTQPPRSGTPGYNSGYPQDSGQYGGDRVRTVGGTVDVSDVRVERNADGFVRILITAETATSGWRIYTNHEISRDTVDVRVRGVPPSSTGARQISHPSAPTIVIPDRNRRLQRVIVRGRNGVRTVNVDGGGSTFDPNRPQTPIDYTNNPPGPGTTQPPYTGGGGTGGGGTGTGSTGGGLSPTEINSLASRVINQTTQLRYDYGATIGVWINRDGSYDLIGQRRPTADERQLLDSLGAMQSSAQALNLNSSNLSARRSNAAKLNEDAKAVENAWRRAPMSADQNQRVRDLLQDVRKLVDNAMR